MMTTRDLSTCCGSRWLLLVVASFLLVAQPRPAMSASSNDGDATAATRDVRAALKDNDYSQAILEANRLIRAGAQVDESLYLKGLAQHHGGAPTEAIATLDVLLAEHADSLWFRKGRFLKADALVGLRQFEAAEAILEDEAHRLLSADRKKELAGVYIQIADDLTIEPDVADVAAPPADYGKAYVFYQRALQMEIDRALRDDVLYKLAIAAYKAGNHSQAIVHLRAYLDAFDPQWTGPVGSLERLRGMKREVAVDPGIHRLDVRYYLGKSQLALQQWHAARQNFEDLRSMLTDPPAEFAPPTDAATRIANTSWQIVRTYHMPSADRLEVDKALTTARTFLEDHRDHRHSIEAAWLIAQTLQVYGRADEAVDAYEAFIAGENYNLPHGARATETIERLGQSAAELEAQWRPLALYSVGAIRYQQRRYDDAINAWQRYVNQFPNGPHWATAQRQIIDAQYMIALDDVADERYDEARTALRAFLAANPLDGRAAQALFILGEIEHAQENWQHAIAEWDKLVSKYPNTEESSLALYRIGIIHEERLSNHEAALAAYRRLTWGSWAQQARARIAIMTQKQLQLETQRTYRTNETPQVHIATRNIEKVTVRQYFLDPEAYFRKTHTIGGVESLDIALIEPDKTWDVEIDAYGKYKPLEQLIDVPFDTDKPGVCIVNVSEDDWEATTLVVRSDLEMMMRTSRREAIVFVQNMRTNTPAGDVTLLFSDGSSVVTNEKTGADGVYHGGFDQLRSVNSLRVFAVADGHVASNALSLSGLNLSQGLSRKGYIYTERPAYQPGQTVNTRGIIRDVADGSYVIPEYRTYIVSVKDAQGRLLREEEVRLSEFGTFDTGFALDPAAAVGRYTISARPKNQQRSSFSGHFEVQQFQLQKMELAIDMDRDVYYRGEMIDATLRASYYWGEPVRDQAVQYTLPDGRSFTEQTDENGELAISFDTSGAMPGTTLGFQATIQGEDVRASRMVYLPRFGFDIAVSTSQSLAMAGEPFDVNLTTTAPDGKPVEASLNVIVLRRETIEPDPVLSNVPWVNLPRGASAEVTIEEHRTTTDPDTGRATLQLDLEDGGQYTIRVAGQDRFDQTVMTQTVVQVSDDDDATKLRIFAGSNTLKVGENASIRLHSRLDEGLALITFEGERVLDYRIIRMAQGYNAVDLGVDHQHFPNFALSATMMSGRALHTASKPFEVQRALKVTLKPLADHYAPGETGMAEIIVTDQLGRPVQGELSLALVNEAILAQYPDQTPDIQAYFQEGARRFVEFRAAATNAFMYEALTRPTVKAFTDEQQRLARAESEDDLRDRAASELRELRAGQRAAPRMRAAGNARASDAMEAIDAESLAQMQDKAMPGAGGGSGGGGGGSLFDDPDNDPARMRSQLSRKLKFAGTETTKSSWAEPRRDRPEAGWWNGSIITDDAGKATIAIPMPETTTRWSLIARGVSVETLVGEATASVVTKDEFFLEIKTPRAALEGDKIRVLARVHDLTGYVGPVDLEMTLKSGDRTFAQNSKTITLKAGEVGQVLFDAVEIPAVGELDVIVRAATRQNAAEAQILTDSIVKTMAVQPFGIQYAAHGGGVSTNSSRLLLTLPEGLTYDSQWMTVTVGPNLNQQIIDMALGTPMLPLKNSGAQVPGSHWHYGRSHASELLAALAGLEYARATNASESDHARLTERARSLISALIVSQHGDGGWSWWRSNRTDFAVTSMAYWALSEATRLGFTVSDDTMTKASALLNQYYQRAASADHEQRAIVLHALSVSGDADFKLANTLYRERNGLTPIALAYAAMALANLDRDDMAVEVLNVLENRASESVAGGRQLVSWHEDSRYHPWLSDRVETTAVALLALMEAHPTSRRIEPAAQYLLQQYGCFGFPNGRSRGPGIAALSQYERAGQFASADFQLIVSVNGTEVETIAADGDTHRVVLNIDPELLRTGRNEIDFSYRGRGRYAYAATMRGFSDQFKDTHNGGPYVRHRHYYHAPLEYRGVTLSASSTSPVQNLAVGQRTRVHVDVWASGHDGYLVVEESMPAGTTLVPGSLTGGNFSHHEVRDGKIIMYIPHGQTINDYSYELVGYTTGGYRALPTVMRDAFDPSQMRVHKPEAVNVLAPGEASDDPYQMNDAERYALGKACFDDGLYGDSLAYLWPLFDRERKYQERDVARMLLWAHTTEANFNAERVVSAFELLSVRHPDLNIPFDRILRVGEAYRYIGEYERAWLVFRATIESSFRNDSMISAVLEDEGQMLSSFAFQQNLWWEYPDIADVASSYFALAQTIYDESPNAHNLKPSTIAMRAADPLDADVADDESSAPTRISMLVDAIEMLDAFLALYPENPLRDDAAFSMTSAFLDLKDYEAVVQLSDRYAEKFADSAFSTSFQYMEALGWFWQRAYQPAIDSATVVATGDSRDRDFARYMLGQIYHAQGKPAEAIDWYNDVRTLYPDAAEAIEHFRHKSLALPEVSIFKPGEDVSITLDYRNLADASLQVYKVDLMKLYLREKNLSNITEVNLAGIAPQHIESFSLGDGKDYADRTRTAQLDLEDEGAYLVICRGDDLFTSGLVLITPLEIDVDEDATSGRVRVNVVDAVGDVRPADVHVKVVGSQNAVFESGDTDLRGIFVADGIQGTVTAIARDADARYAFYRGEAWLGAPAQSGRGRNTIDTRAKNIEVDYTGNLRQQQLELQRSNRANFDAYRRAGEKGVEVQKAR